MKKKKKKHLIQIQGHCHKYGLQKFITLITIGIFWHQKFSKI